MDKIKGCGKHEEAKQGCQICNGKIGTFHGRAKQIGKLMGMNKAYGPAGDAQITAEIAELERLQNLDKL